MCISMKNVLNQNWNIFSCERREGGREGGRKGEREGERKGGREGERKGGREGERKGGREGEREKGKEGGREKGGLNLSSGYLVIAMYMYMYIQ